LYDVATRPKKISKAVDEVLCEEVAMHGYHTTTTTTSTTTNTSSSSYSWESLQDSNIQLSVEQDQKQPGTSMNPHSIHHHETTWFALLSTKPSKYDSMYDDGMHRKW
jgi:hypothetical protein